MLQSHATAYFYLVVPEMMFGMDAAPEQRNLLGLIEADPALMRRVIMLRKWGQEVIKTVFGRRMHGISSVPGGVDKNLSRAECDRLLNGEEGLPSIDEVIDYAQDGLRLFYDFHEKNRSEVDGFANVPALNMSLVDADGNVDYYHGMLRIVDEDKHVVRDIRLPRLPRPFLGSCRRVELHEVPLPQGTRQGKGLGSGGSARRG